VCLAAKPRWSRWRPQPLRHMTRTLRSRRPWRVSAAAAAARVEGNLSSPGDDRSDRFEQFGGRSFPGEGRKGDVGPAGSTAAVMSLDVIRPLRGKKPLCVSLYQVEWLPFLSALPSLFVETKLLANSLLPRPPGATSRNF
jgi:hypothetical protein